MIKNKYTGILIFSTVMLYLCVAMLGICIVTHHKGIMLAIGNVVIYGVTTRIWFDRWKSNRVPKRLADCMEITDRDIQQIMSKLTIKTDEESE